MPPLLSVTSVTLQALVKNRIITKGLAEVLLDEASAGYIDDWEVRSNREVGGPSQIQLVVYYADGTSSTFNGPVYQNDPVSTPQNYVIERGNKSYEPKRSDRDSEEVPQTNRSGQ